MKKYLFTILILVSAKALQAQSNYNNNNDDNYESPGFKKENVFLGGSVSLNLGFGAGGGFGIGANPEIGYSVAQWLDAGIAFNINYLSQKYYDINTGANLGKASSFNYGAGVFGRVYPLQFLFLQVQPEINWINYTQKDNAGNRFTNTVSAPSLIGGIGYTQRVVTQGSYFFMIGLDLLNDVNSPYNDGYNRAQPIIRAGFDVYLHPSRKPRAVGPSL